MSRKLMAVLVASAFAFGSVSTSAWSAPDTTAKEEAQAVQTGSLVKNEPPLPPAGAASIKQAQGFADDHPLLVSAIYLGVAVLVLILIDGDDDETSTPGT